MEIPAIFYTWENSPGRKAYFLRWLGRKIEIEATHVAIFGNRIKRKGQYEKKREIDIASLLSKIDE